VDANAIASWGFPGADEMGNMFQVYRDFEGAFLANRSVDTSKALNPELMNFRRLDPVLQEQDPRLGCSTS
jgi:hypothetical protein